VEEAAACAIVARRLATMSRLTPEVQTRRLVGVLARRGYPEGMARRVVLTAMREGQCGQGAQQP
jgi:regulatory protein